MSKMPFSQKNERIANVFEDCESTQCGAIQIKGVKRPFDPNIMTLAVNSN